MATIINMKFCCFSLLTCEMDLAYSCSFYVCLSEWNRWKWFFIFFKMEGEIWRISERLFFCNYKMPSALAGGICVIVVS